jgi:hypothetical protein
MDLGARAEGIGFGSGFLTVGAGRGSFGTGTVGFGAIAKGIGLGSGFLAMGAGCRRLEMVQKA